MAIMGLCEVDMNLAELSPQTVDRIKAYRWDRIIEKHEGPETWESVLK